MNASVDMAAHAPASKYYCALPLTWNNILKFASLFVPSEANKNVVINFLAKYADDKRFSWFAF